MKAVILQSNYIPWKGYFDLMSRADVFIIYDEVQYTKNDWRNRNKIKTANGLLWLTIPVKQEKLSQRIIDTQVHSHEWRKKHWSSITMSYSRASYFRQYRSLFEELYLNSSETYLSRINYSFFVAINEVLGINTKLIWSNDLNLVEGQSERLVDLCKKVGADEYISGPAAKEYLQTDLFEKENIKVSWMDYSGYPEYRQLYPPFKEGVSILDLIFNEGPESSRFLKSFNKTQ
ncbi:MAG: WbqC family protein [Chitinophagaceae bacterium]